MRQTHEQHLRRRQTTAETRIEKGQLRKPEKIHQAIGRLHERYARVARYYRIDYQAQQKNLAWEENYDQNVLATKLDGGYLLKTDRQDPSAEEIWRTYILLTRVEAAFRAMKSPLLGRPIFPHLETRTQPHIFLCVLDYHLLVAIGNVFWIRECTPRGGPCCSNSALIRWSP